MSRAATVLGTALGLALIYAFAIVPQLDDEDVDLRAPRTVHLSDTGVLLVADVGTGHDDGQIVAIDPETEKRTVLREGLDSVPSDSEPIGNISGPTAARFGNGGELCVLYSGVLARIECEGREAVSFAGDPFNASPWDFVSDGADGWYISDGANDRILRVQGNGTVVSEVDLFSVFVGTNLGVELPAIPLGVGIGPEGELQAALFSGAALTTETSENGDSPDEISASIMQTAGLSPVAIIDDSGVRYVLDYGAGRESGSITVNGFPVVAGLDRPTGFALLESGRFAITEQESGNVRIVQLDQLTVPDGGAGGVR